MGKSKFQAKVKENMNRKSASGTRVKYYDEEITPKKSSGFAIFFMVIILIAGGVVGIGSLLDNAAEDLNENPNYVVDTNTYTDDPESRKMRQMRKMRKIMKTKKLQLIK